MMPLTHYIQSNFFCKLVFVEYLVRLFILTLKVIQFHFIYLVMKLVHRLSPTKSFIVYNQFDLLRIV